MSNSKIVFFVTGSIAAFKTATVVSRLVQSGCEVQCILSAAAARFIGPATFEGLTGRPVLLDLWESGRAMDHIQVSRWADFGVICPASANALAKMSLGLADDLVSSALLAWPKGKLLHVFPAMNAEMLSAETTQTHIQSLRARGMRVADSGSGSLACGEFGIGRLLEPDEIIKILLGETPAEPKSQKKRVLITAGATREPIDGIRFISNHSTGRTGAELATALKSAGWSVTYLHGQGAITAAADKTLIFSSYQDLRDKLRAELGENFYNAIVHCAAVGDFTVNESCMDQKLSSGQELNLQLKPTAKILPELREFSRNKKIRVIGFKLTLNKSHDEMLADARKILTENVDAIVANDWSRIQSARDLGRPEEHPGVLVSAAGEHEFKNVNGLVEVLNGSLS